MDEQPISHLVVDESQRVSDWNLCVELGGISKITPYRETDGSLWFSLYIGEKMIRRVNGKFVVEVGYQQED